jgi:hypothetical protein
MKKLFENWRKHLNEADDSDLAYRMRHDPAFAQRAATQTKKAAAARAQAQADRADRAAEPEHKYIHGDLAELVCGDTYTPGAWKCFGIEEFEKVFLGRDDDKKRANIKLTGHWPNQVLSYNTPDGKYVELPAGDSDDSFLAAINRWDDYFRAGGGMD